MPVYPYFTHVLYRKFVISPQDQRTCRHSYDIRLRTAYCRYSIGHGAIYGHALLYGEKYWNLRTPVIRKDFLMKDYTKGKSPERLEPFFPNELFRHIIVSCFIVTVELAAIILFPLPCKLIKKPDHIPWFLLPIYNLDRLIHSEVIFVSILILCALLFISWPFLASDRKYHASPFKKTEGINSSHAQSVKEHRNLWQMPIPCMIVIITLVSVITLCLINP